jgi:hypothetical protein
MILPWLSEVVEHEVLSAHSDRLAITMWVSGRGSLHSSPATATATSEEVEGGIGTDALPAPPLSTPTALSTGAPRNTLSDSSSFGLTALDRARHSQSSIFVAVASYRDSELKHTLASLFGAADRPERVAVGVVLQTHPTDDPRVFGIGLVATEGEDCVSPLQQWLKDNVRVMHVPASTARGPCVARAQCLSLWRGEEFFLQTDAHMRFRRCWDSYLLHLHSAATAQTKTKGEGEAILTTYPSGYSLSSAGPSDRDRDRALPPTDIRPTVLVSALHATHTALDPRHILKTANALVSQVPTHFDSDGMLRQTGRILRDVLMQPVRVGLWAAGFSFSRATPMMELAPYDPRLEDLFFGEEVYMAARCNKHVFSVTSRMKYCYRSIITSHHITSHRIITLYCAALLKIFANKQGIVLHKCNVAADCSLKAPCSLRLHKQWCITCGPDLIGRPNPLEPSATRWISRGAGEPPWRL